MVGERPNSLFMELRNAMSSPKVVDRIYGIISSGFESAVDLGYMVCIQIPKRALVLYLHLQKELLLLPFRILYRVYEALVKGPVMLLLRFYQILSKEDPTPVELLTGEKNPSADKIMESVKEVRRAALKTINRENKAKSKLHAYRKQLESWKLENEKKTEELYKLSVEDKELMKAVAAALRHLRSLKTKREKMNESFIDNVKAVIDNGNNSAEKLLALQRKIKIVDAAIKEKREACLNMLSQGQIIDNLCCDIEFSKSSNRETVPLSKGQSQIQPTCLGTLQKIITLVTDENVHLKDKLSITHDKLEKILKLSETINEEIILLSEKVTKMSDLNNEMHDLQNKLEEERRLLRAVEADRDGMKEKLEILASMIKEEEEFLDGVYDTGCSDSGYSSYAVKYCASEQCQQA